MHRADDSPTMRRRPGGKLKPSGRGVNGADRSVRSLRTGSGCNFAGSMADEPGMFRTNGPGCPMTGAVVMAAVAVGWALTAEFSRDRYGRHGRGSDRRAADGPRAARARSFRWSRMPCGAGIHSKIGRRHAPPGRLAADRASSRLVKIGQAGPVSEFAMAAALVVVDWHALARSLRAGAGGAAEPRPSVISGRAPDRFWTNRPVVAVPRRWG